LDLLGELWYLRGICEVPYNLFYANQPRDMLTTRYCACRTYRPRYVEVPERGGSCLRTKIVAVSMETADVRFVPCLID